MKKNLKKDFSGYALQVTWTVPYVSIRMRIARFIANLLLSPAINIKYVTRPNKHSRFHTK